MKNIELTEEHKTKLLEMCKVLFPEYPDLQFGVKEKHNWSKEYLVFGLMSDEPIIHWFEFCMTHLLDRLHPDNDKQGKDNWSMDLSDKDYVIFKIIVRKRHPVDYLYKEFKKLK